MSDLDGPLIVLALVVAVLAFWVSVFSWRVELLSQEMRWDHDDVKNVRVVLKMHKDSLEKLETQIRSLRQKMEGKDGDKTNS